MTDMTQKYLNRELSWLEFNQRVLDEALDPSVPLLERLKFLAISASNLDEFFRVRVGGLQMLRERGVGRPDPTGLSPAQQLELIEGRVRKLQQDQYDCYFDELAPRLGQSGILHVSPKHLSERQLNFLERFFEGEIFSVLAPLAVSGRDDFPLLPNESLNVCVRLRSAPRSKSTDDSTDRFAVIPLGNTLARLITLPAEGGLAYLLLEDAVAMFVDRFFEGERIQECVPFRVTRNADVSLQEEGASDLTTQMEALIQERRQAECVRLEMSAHADDETVHFLTESLGIGEHGLYQHDGPLDLSELFSLATRPGFDDLKDTSWTPQRSTQIAAGATMFEAIAARDLLLAHPYESFEPVVRFVEEAADDPDVLAIKQTLYRTSRDSRIVTALIRAAENGKHVTVIVELKARFDEARNIRWARTLEEAGAQVIYGVRELKTHAKCCIVVRHEPEGIRRYVHFGTGNYNESTARLYSDFSLLTCNDELGADAVAFFNAATGASQPQSFRKLDAAPLGLRDALLELIDSEIERKRQGQQARITAKLNALVDPRLIEALYAASQAGVEVRLNIRGICCLRPGVQGLSENIEVVRIIDRFLEHARIISFHHGGDPLVFLSSADWMPRNLDGRIELLIPVEDPDCCDRLLAFLDRYFLDNVKSTVLQPDGTQRRRTFNEHDPECVPYRVQEELSQMVSEGVRAEDQQRLTEFVPHRAPGT